MNKVDILTDISTLTAVSRLSLENLCAKANLAISHGVLEATHKLDNQIECNIGIGLLYIKIEHWRLLVCVNYFKFNFYIIHLQIKIFVLICWYGIL